nr:hypothetical protein M3p_00015 [Serratia entomophila]ULG12365.1 hypothetical protein M3p_00069 [Serratia entomophila]
MGVVVSNRKIPYQKLLDMFEPGSLIASMEACSIF